MSLSICEYIKKTARLFFLTLTKELSNFYETTFTYSLLQVGEVGGNFATWVIEYNNDFPTTSVLL